MKFTFLILILQLPFLAIAGDDWGSFPTSQLSEEGQRAYNVIRGASAFKTGGMGVAGIRSGEELAFRILLEEEHAIKALKRLLVYADSAGKIYALCGLHLLDSDGFKQAIKKIENPEAIVSVELLSCSPEERKQTIKTLIRSIENGDYDSYFKPKDKKKQETNQSLQ